MRALILAGVALVASVGALGVGAAEQVSAPLVVVDATGRPVAGAAVEVLAPPRTGSLLSGVSAVVLREKTDEAGRVPAPVPALDDLTVLVDHPDFAPHAGPLSPGQRVVLDKGRAIAGRLVAADGAPVVASEGRACARWTVPLEAWRSRCERERCVALTDADRFEIGALGTARVEVVVEVPRFLPGRARAEPGAGEPIAVELRPGVLVRGEIVDPAGRPVPEAIVTEERTGAAHRLRSGQLEIGVERLPVELEVRASGFRPRRVRVANLDQAAGLRVVLQPGQQLRGQVVSESGEPVEEIELGVERFEPPSGWSLDEVDLELEEGAFEIDLPEPGRYRFRVSAAGHRATDVPELDVQGGASVDLGPVFLSRGSGVRGRVINPASGEGLGGADVRLLPLGTAVVETLRRGELRRATSDAGGRFAVTGLDAGRFELRIQRSGRAELAREVRLERDRIEDLGEIPLGRGGLVHGRVSDRERQPLGDVEVRFFGAATDSIEPLAVWRTEAGGRFVGQRFAAGEYRVEVHRRRPLLAQQVAIEDDEDDVELDLVVSTVELHGLVRRDGQPVAGGVIAVSSDLDSAWQRGKVLIHSAGQLEQGTVALGVPTSRSEAIVAPDGTFLIEDAPAGPVSVTYYPTAGEPVARRVVVEDRSRVWLEIDLDGGTLTGRVVDGETGAGVAAWLRLLDAAGRVVREIESAGDGAFAVADLDAGPFALEASANGYSTVTQGEVRPGPEPVLVRLEPGEASGLELRLVRSDGGPAAGAQVNLLSEGGRTVRSLLADAHGVRHFEDLPRGTYFVVWNDSVGGIGASREITVEAGETRRVDLEVRPGAPLILSCPADRCRSGSVEQVALFTAAGIEIGAFLGIGSSPIHLVEDGFVRLGLVEPGQYLLRLWKQGKAIEHLVQVGTEGVVVGL